MKCIVEFQHPQPSEVDERYHPFNAGSVGYVLYWKKYFDLVKNVPGAIVECGTGRGRSLITIAALNELLEKHEGGGRDIWGFDSFEGFDEPCEPDSSSRNPKKGEWSCSPSGKYKYTQEFIYDVINRAGIQNPENKIKLVKGFLKDSLKHYDGKPISILHIDCDLYEPYKNALEMLYDFVSPGGIIIFDDFFIDEIENEPFPGSRKATYEFLGTEKDNLQPTIKRNPYYIKPGK